MVLRKIKCSKQVVIGSTGSIKAEQTRKRTQLKNAEQPFNNFTEHSEEHLRQNDRGTAML